jgi:hypothetical protein
MSKILVKSRIGKKFGLLKIIFYFKKKDFSNNDRPENINLHFKVKRIDLKQIN